MSSKFLLTRSIVCRTSRCSCVCRQVGSLTTVKSTECLCTHLSTFGSDFYVPPNTIDFKTVFKKFKKLHENAAVFSTVIVILALYVMAAIWARRKDEHDLVKVSAVEHRPCDVPSMSRLSARGSLSNR
jgi:hypothetical protein